MDQLDMLPDEVEEQIRLQREVRLGKLESFGRVLSAKRDDAVKARANSGIEQEWIESEEQYQGIDDANRGESRGALKPRNTDGSFINPSNKPKRSTVYLNITRPYVDAAAARVADMLLPTDDRNWGICPTPIPELAFALKDERPVKRADGAQLMSPNGTPVLVKDIATKEQDAAKKKAEAAEKRIEDWLVECQYHAEVRKVIEDCAKLGTGILKGPFPKKSKRIAAKMVPGGKALEMTVEIMPASKRIDPWRFYPDGACGESIHNGQYVWEEDDITVRQVKDLKGTPGYMDDQIDKVLEEGPGKRYENSNRLGINNLSDKEKFQIWYFHGLVEKDDLEVAGVDVSGIDGGAHAIVTMINDTVIKAALQPLDDGEFPYDMMPWQRKTNMPWGSGVAHHIRTPQRIVVAGARNLMDNAGISAGGQFVMRRGVVEPADGDWNITPRKIWFIKEDADVRSVNDVFASVTLPSLQQELMNIIQFAMKMAEDVTGLPQLLQGMQGKAPDTVGGMQMLQNNASSVLRRIARTFDDCLTEPHIRRYYKWLMEYGESEEEKGDFTIDARGSTALVERDIAQQAILNMGQLISDPRSEMSYSKWLKEAMKSQKIDPKRFEMDEQEKEAAAKRQPAPAPVVQAAQIRADTQLQVAQIENQTAQVRIKTDTDRDRAYVESETRRDQAEYEARMQELAIKREIEILKYSTQQNISLEEAKTQLARDALKLNVQKELAAAASEIDMHKHYNPPQVATPAMEPVGRAPDGQAFQR